MKKFLLPAIVIGVVILSSGAAAGSEGGPHRALAHADSHSAARTSQAASARYVLHLRNRSVTASAGEFDLKRIAAGASSASARAHFMLQFKQLPTAAEHQAIERNGVRLIGYLGSFTYSASAPTPWLGVVRLLPHVRSAQAFQTADKLSPTLRTGKLPAWAKTKSGAVTMIVRFFDDVPTSVGSSIVRRLGGTPIDVSTAVRAVTAHFPKASVSRLLAAQDEVEYVDVPAAPMVPAGMSAAASTGAPTLWAAPYGLNGAGQTVFVYDGGEVDARHPDFGNRVTDYPTPGTAGASFGMHATHVGGIIAGSGANSSGAVVGGATTLASGTVVGSTLIVPTSLIFWTNAAWVGATSSCTVPAAPPACPYNPAWQPGDTVQIGTGANAEIAVIAAWNPNFTGYVVAVPLQVTHAAGEPVVMLNNGTVPQQYAGVAPGAAIYSEDGLGNGSDLQSQPGSIQADFQRAVNAGSSTANMSLANGGTACARNGSYNVVEQLFDRIVPGLLGSSLSFTIAAANNRPNTANAGCVNYGTLSASAAAKNAITVGAINGDDGAIASFSSWGPTQDGRVKPDLAAPGCTSGNEAGANLPGDGPGIVAADFRDLYQPAGGANTGANPNPNGHWDDGTVAGAALVEPRSTYAWECGTSMAAPAAAGAIAIIGQDWTKVHGSTPPSPATVKAILVQSATRPPAGPQAAPGGAATGPIPGAGATWTWPNFVEGFGQLNLKAAVDLVNDDARGDWIKTDQLANATPNQTKTYQFYSSGANDVTATLVWDDPAGPLLAAKELTNQLSLTLTDPSGAVWNPWVANPVNPAAPPVADTATRGVDTLNNVQLAVAPKKQGIWTATVTGTAIATAQPQKFTLIAPPSVNGLSISDTQVNEGDSGPVSAVFTISRSQASDRPQSVTYATSSGTATSADFTSASGTATIPAGQLATTISVALKPNTTAQPDRAFTVTISNPQPDQPLIKATATGTILDDDSGLEADIIAKTGQTVGGQTISNIQNDVSINTKSEVGFAADVSPAGGTGLFIGNSTDPLRLINPNWTNRRFDAAIQLNDTDQMIAKDVLAGSPPATRIRRWNGNSIDDYTILGAGGSSQSYDATVIPGMNDHNNGYFFLGLTGSQWSIVTDSGASEQYNAVLRPWITNDDHIVYRAGDFIGDVNHQASPIVLDDTTFSTATRIACPTGCVHPGFSQIGRSPAASNDSQFVTFYGVYTNPNVQIPQGPGIYASIHTASGRTLVKVAGVGDSGIGSFEPDTRIGVNSTQASDHGVTLVYLAYDAAGNKGVYTSRINLLPAQGQPYDPTNPGSWKVVPPHRVVSVGDRIRGVGPVNDLNVWDSVNDHGSGDIAFWVQSGSIQAVVRIHAHEVPLLFVPGVAGSTLVDHANGDQAIWLPSLAHALSMDSFLGAHLSLRPEDATGTDILPTGAMDYIIPAISYGPQYAPILDYLGTKGYKQYKLGTIGQNVRACDTSQIGDHPNLFVFPYDWRQSNTVNSSRLNSYMECIQKFYPGEKVNVLTHSMGGLLTRRTILEYPTFAKHVNTLTTVTPPWLGAPKLQYVMLTGDFIPGTITGPGVFSAMQSTPGPHELMPSQGYYDAINAAQAGGASPDAYPLPLGEQGRNIDGDVLPIENNNELFDFATMIKVMNFQDPRFQPGAAADNFHSYSIAPGVGQDDWHNDTFGFPFYELYGVQSDANTLGQTLATSKPLCVPATNPDGTTFENCRADKTFLLKFVKGDGTVPETSANRPSALNPPDAHIIPFSESGSSFAGSPNMFEHTGILANPDVQSQIIDILQKNGGPPDPALPHPVRRVQVSRAHARARAALDAAANEQNISIYGGDGTVVADNAGHSTAMLTVGGVQYGIPATVPNVGTYVLGDHDRLVRSFSSSPLTTTFTVTGGAVEVDIVDGPDSAPTRVTRYMDVNMPAGATVQVTSAAGTAPQLSYDSNGDNTVDTVVPPAVAVTGAAAKDMTPPTLANTRVRHDGLTDVTIAATDPGTGVAAVWYSLDGTKFFKYTAAVRIDPTAVQWLYAYADDNAGNRSAAVRFKVGERQADQPNGLDVGGSTDENQAVPIVLKAQAPSGEPLTYVVATQPTNGTVVVNGATATYTPKRYFFGSDSFTFTADDGYLTSTPATVSVTVRHVNQPPEVTLTAPASVTEGASPAAITAKVWDPDGDTFTLKWSTTIGRLVTNGTSATFAADDGPATAKVTLVATDSHGAAGTGPATIAVSNVAPSVTVVGPQTQPWGLTVSVSGSATDVGPTDRAAGLTPSWSFGDGSASQPGYSGTHVYANPGSFAAKLSVSDKDGGVGTGNVAVTVSKRASSLTYTGATSGSYGFVTLSAKLADTIDAGSARLAGHLVTFIVGSQAFVATTDATGTATVTPAPMAPGSYPVAANLGTDSLYASASGRSTLVISSSAGSAAGTGLTPKTGGTASFTVTSTSGGITGSLDYTLGTTSIHATSLAPFGIRADGHAAWFNGVDSLGRKITVYIEDNGAGTADVFKLSLNGVLLTGTGALTGGDVLISSG